MKLHMRASPSSATLRAFTSYQGNKKNKNLNGKFDAQSQAKITAHNVQMGFVNRVSTGSEEDPRYMGLQRHLEGYEKLRDPALPTNNSGYSVPQFHNEYQEIPDYPESLATSYERFTNHSVSRNEPRYTSLDTQSNIYQEIANASHRGIPQNTATFWMPMSHQVPIPRRDQMLRFPRQTMTFAMKPVRYGNHTFR